MASSRGLTPKMAAAASEYSELSAGPIEGARRRPPDPMADPGDALDATALRLASLAAVVERVLYALQAPAQPREKQEQQPARCEDEVPAP